MKKSRFVTIISIACLFLFFFNLTSSFPQQGKSQKSQIESSSQSIYAKIDRLTNAQGQYFEKEKVYKVGFPRSDLKPDIAGVRLTPAMGLGVWAAFMIMGDQAMVMGDTVLSEDQVNPVMGAVLDNSLEVTAIHNHFFWDSPKIMFMHISGTGDTEKLAAAVGKVFAKIKETSGGKGEKPYADIDSAKTTLDPARIENIIGVKGQMTNGVYKITIGRKTNMRGMEVGNAMGVNTWAAFAGSDEKAVVDGDFVMFEEEVQSVLKALRGAGINIVALHNHMLMESPRMIFLHFWGIGLTTDLAKGLRAALDTQGKPAK